MTSNASLVRKVAYILAIVVLFFPLVIMSSPATVKRDDAGRIERQTGGTLSEMRDQAGLSQAQLGEIDPASETMKLATFGLRGVAVVLLWDRANEFKKKEDWDNLSATLEQIARLQPNFVTVWEHQAHNLSYNVSVEFDDYRQRYHWVKKGIDYLIDGSTYNRNEPRLLWYTGWVVGQKIGRSDERVQFRRMFRDDTEFHTMLARQLNIDSELSIAKGPDGKPDNWLVGRQWYLRAQRTVDVDKKSIGGKSPALFHASPVMSLINNASDMEKEPDFDQEYTQATWSKGLEEWISPDTLPDGRPSLGQRILPTSGGFTIQLNDVERLETEISELTAKLESLLPGVRAKIRAERIAALPEIMRKSLEKDDADRSATDRNNVYQAEQAIAVQHLEVAQRAPTDKSIEARRLALRLLTEEEQLRYTHTSRTVVNYEFWRDRSAAGATETNSRARKLLFEAKQLFAKPALAEAKAKFEESFEAWAEVFEKWPLLHEDAENDDLVAAVETYIRVLEQLDLRDKSGGILPQSFPLKRLMIEKGHEHLLKFREEETTEDAPPEPPAAETTTPAPEVPPATKVPE